MDFFIGTMEKKMDTAIMELYEPLSKLLKGGYIGDYYRGYEGVY